MRKETAEDIERRRTERAAEKMAETDAEEKKYAYWLNSIPDIGIRTINRLLETIGSPQCLYHTEVSRLKPLLQPRQFTSWEKFTSEWDVDGEYDRLLHKGIRFLTVCEREYPSRLREIPDPPYGLFVKGKVPDTETLAVAVVGARECSEYGKYTAQALGRCLAENGVQVVSGMAKGIDGISQRAAMEAGGRAYAVLGCGVDICYPAQNRAIYDQLPEKGGILSPYPPGTQPQPGLFPPRNRIVSGLADVVVVVEARQKSGTLITVDMALEQGREVYVVPGRLTDRLSDGCNRLIKQGAGVLLSPEEFVRELGEIFPGREPKGFGGKKKKASMGMPCGKDASEGKRQEADSSEGNRQEIDALILSAVDFYPKSVEQIQKALKQDVPYRMVVQHLMRLCLTGEVCRVSAGYFAKSTP